jgi:4'-phosphopantetheinyl transferase
MQPSSPVGLQAAWPQGPSKPQLPEGVAHVWKVDLTTADERLEELLSEQERARAARLLSERDRLHWTRSRGLLRALLGRYLDVDPGTLRFTAGAHGKPELLDRSGTSAVAAATAGAIDPSSLSFNLSHSDTLALYCFARGVAVGVDVEVDRRPIDELALAERMLDAPTVARLRALSEPALRRREFLRAWTRHEAQLKCLGIGIGGSGDGATQPIWVADLSLGDGVAGAVACEREAPELTCWTWEDDQGRGTHHVGGGLRERSAD